MARQQFLVDQFALALETLAGGAVGFGLCSSLGQQTQRFLGRTGNLFFKVAQILFRALCDLFQPRL